MKNLLENKRIFVGVLTIVIAISLITCGVLFFDDKESTTSVSDPAVEESAIED